MEVERSKEDAWFADHKPRGEPLPLSHTNRVLSHSVSFFPAFRQAASEVPFFSLAAAFPRLLDNTEIRQVLPRAAYVPRASRPGTARITEVDTTFKQTIYQMVPH